MPSKGSDPRLDRATPLRPGDAAAAILTVGGRYFLQLRDNIPGIFFPAHWGCFGGGVDAGESTEQAIRRELTEELGLSLAGLDLRFFSRFEFGLEFLGAPKIWRDFYEVELPEDMLAGLVLGEGSDMRLFDPADILMGAIPITPYDSFALWFHINRVRLLKP